MTRRPVPLARLESLLTSERGLTAAEVSERRLRYGPNDIVEAPPSRWWDLARETVRDPMIWFLAGVSVLYSIVGETAEALVLLVAIAPLAGMDAFLHRRTQASTQGLRSRLAERAVVIRDGVSAEIPALELLPATWPRCPRPRPFPPTGSSSAGANFRPTSRASPGRPTRSPSTRWWARRDRAWSRASTPPTGGLPARAF